MTDAIPGTHQLGALGSKTPFVLSEPREVDILVPRAGEEPEAGGSSWACQATGSEVGGLNWFPFLISLAKEKTWALGSLMMCLLKEYFFRENEVLC